MVLQGEPREEFRGGLAGHGADVVEVPVYPPFRLAERPTSRKPPARMRSAPSLKRKRTSSGQKQSEASED